MIDWGSVGGGLMAVGAGAWGWWERRRRKRAQRATAELEAWDGEERRHHQVLTGRKVVVLIEEDTAPMPRHWLAEVAGVAAHKVNGAMSAPLLRLEAVEQGLRDLREDMKTEGQSIRAEMRSESADTRKSVEKVGSLVQRLIGRAFPNTPIE